MGVNLRALKSFPFHDGRSTGYFGSKWYSRQHCRVRLTLGVLEHIRAPEVIAENTADQQHETKTKN